MSRKAGSHPNSTIGKASRVWSPLDEAEARLFPNRPYATLTLGERQETYTLAKELLFTMTGRVIK